MLKVYFDKNVLSHLIGSQRGDAETNGVTKDDLKALLDAVAAGRITNLLSLMHLQEASYALRASSPSVAKEELQLIRGLLDTSQIIKFPRDLLIDDVISYAAGQETPPSRIPNPLDLDELFSADGNIEERKKVLDETDAHSADFLKATTNAKANDRAYVIEEFGGKQPTFQDFYNKKIVERILETVQRVEQETKQDWVLTACKEQGLEAMLKIKSMALAEGASLSYQYARIFDEMSEKKRKRLGDPGDLNHALFASAGDVLVTHDADFAAWIDRIQNKGIEVIDHVHKLVEQVS